MSADILNEMEILLSSLVLGAAITFVYDILRILRRIIKHSIFFISAEDVLYWLFCSVCIFRMLYQENNGVIRWFVVLGAGLGMIFYRLSAGRFFVKVISGILNRILRCIYKPLGRIWKFFKKKLTVSIKVFKMILCKR